MTRTLARPLVPRLFALVAVAAILAACTPSPAPTPPTTGGQQPAATAGTTAKQGEKLTFALATWGTESPLIWRAGAQELQLWEIVYDYLLMRDPKDFSLKPGLATEWSQATDLKSVTFKLRKGVQFHENWGEMTADDLRFNIEMQTKEGMNGSGVAFFRPNLDRIETPDPYTLIVHFKSAIPEPLEWFAQLTGYGVALSKKYFDSVGEEKAAAHPIGTGPFRHIEGRAGDFHRFEAVANHWRVTPGFKELTVRRITDPGARVAAFRSGEVDIIGVFGDFFDQVKKGGARIHETPRATMRWVVLGGQTTPDKEDYCPTCPWVGDATPQGRENARKVRLAMNYAVDKKAIIDQVLRSGSQDPGSYWYYPANTGFSTEWKVPAYDVNRAKQLLSEAGYPNGFEIRVGIVALQPEAPDIMEAVALDWEKVGIKVRRVQEDNASFLGKIRGRKVGPTAYSYSTPFPGAEPLKLWLQTVWSKGPLYLLAENWDPQIDEIQATLDRDKRSRLMAETGKSMYESFPAVMLGWQNATWAVSKRVGDWPTLPFTNLENNIEYITWSGQ